MQIASFLICIRNGLCQNGRFMILDKWHLAERMDHACVKTWRRTQLEEGGTGRGSPTRPPPTRGWPFVDLSARLMQPNSRTAGTHSNSPFLVHHVVHQF